MAKERRKELHERPGWTRDGAARLRKMGAVFKERAGRALSEEGRLELRKAFIESVQTAMAVVRTVIQVVAGKLSGTQEPAPAPGSSEAPLNERSKQELYSLAKKLDIPGRSKMSKQELVEAIQGNE